MTPNLSGRLQLRIFILGTLGLLWTAVLTPFLLRPSGASLGEAYETTIGVLAAVAVLGLLWELLYHFLQQFRWDKDWPTLFGLLTGINEGLVLWLLISGDLVPWISEALAPSLTAFSIHFSSTWLIVWLFLNGPMRVVLLRWRFRGGAIL